MTSTTAAIRFDRAASKRAQLLDTLAFLYHSRQRPIAALELEAETGLTRGQISEALKVCREHGEVFIVGRGLYAPVVQHAAPRAISLTMLADGSAKLEVGDCLMELGPLEYRTLTRLVGGIASEAAQLAAESNAAGKLSMLSAKAAQTEDLLKRMAELLAAVAPVPRVVRPPKDGYQQKAHLPKL